MIKFLSVLGATAAIAAVHETWINNDALISRFDKMLRPL